MPNNRTRLPLPINTYADWNVGPLYTADQMHAYSDAENAALRERVKVLEEVAKYAAAGNSTPGSLQRLARAALEAK